MTSENVLFKSIYNNLCFRYFKSALTVIWHVHKIIFIRKCRRFNVSLMQGEEMELDLSFSYKNNLSFGKWRQICFKKNILAYGSHG